MKERKEVFEMECHPCRPHCDCGTLLCGELRVSANLFKPGERLRITVEPVEEKAVQS